MATVKPKAPLATSRPPIVLPAHCEQLLNREQVCAALGISARTFHIMLTTGELPAPDTRLCKRPRWRVATLNRWVQDRCGVKPESNC